MKVKYKKSTILAINAMFMALAIIFVFVQLPGIVSSAALMLLPTIIVAQLLGFTSAIFQSLVLGIMLFIKGFSFITAPTDIALQNPLISIMPRVIVAILVFFLAKFLNKLLKKIVERKEKNKIKINALESLISILVSSFGAFLNSVIVLIMFYLFYKNSEILGTTKITFNFILTIFATVSSLEILFTAIIAPPLVILSRKLLEKILEKE